MANENISDVVSEGRSLGGQAPGLVGVYGRLRIEVLGKPVGTLVIDGPRVALTPDTTGPADAIIVCCDDESFRKLLKGELNPFVASMRGQARIKGDRNFGTRVMLGLRAGSPFVNQMGQEA
jgi:hypothetical protein